MKAPAFFFFACALSTSLPAASAFAQESGQPYPQARAAMLAQGWKPNTGYGLKLPGGRPMHRFPEVLCGPTRCNAKWRDAGGREQIIWMVRRGLTEDYLVE